MFFPALSPRRALFAVLLTLSLAACQSLPPGENAAAFADAQPFDIHDGAGLYPHAPRDVAGFYGCVERNAAYYDGVLAQLGTGESAIPWLRKLVAMALYKKGIALLAAGKNAEALTVYETLAQRFATAPYGGMADEQGHSLAEIVAAARVPQGVALMRLGRQDEALALYARIEAETHCPHLERDIPVISLEALDDEMQRCRRAHAASPQNADACIDAATQTHLQAFERQQELLTDNALCDAYRQQSFMQELLQTARFNRALILQQQGQSAEAQALWAQILAGYAATLSDPYGRDQSALQQEPLWLATRLAQAQSWLAEGRLDEAQTALDEAMPEMLLPVYIDKSRNPAAPRVASLLYALAERYEQTGQRRKALRIYRTLARYADYGDFDSRTKPWRVQLAQLADHAEQKLIDLHRQQGEPDWVLEYTERRQARLARLAEKQGNEPTETPPAESADVLRYDTDECDDPAACYGELKSSRDLLPLFIGLFLSDMPYEKSEQDQRLAILEEIQRRFGDDPKPATQAWVLEAVISQAVAWLDRDPKQALDILDRARTRYGALTQTHALRQLARLEKWRSQALLQMGEPEAASRNALDADRRFGGIPDGGVSCALGWALDVRIQALLQLGRYAEVQQAARAAFNDFSGTEKSRRTLDWDCHNHQAIALHAEAHAAEASLIQGHLRRVLQLASRGAGGDETLPPLAVFLYWLQTPDSDLTYLRKHLHNNPPTQPARWQPSRLQPLIDKLPQPRKGQAQCLLGYFQQPDSAALDVCLRAAPQ